MVGLVDIVPKSETVMVGDTAVAVSGISARGVAYLLSKFPDLRKLMSGQPVGDDIADAVMRVAPDAIAAIIAAGIGKPGDAEQEAAADQLTLEPQADLLAAILRLTLPRGIGPFAEKLAALMGSVGSSAPGTPAVAPATTSVLQ